ncbi:hypothetical protein KGA66_02570 [Actinocrinis puniceicyclus]|uniref:Uncharacterized protein n=1 Tax=Actinocrinis puniceicyclus TaxID=977794 RepID=A0A8J7WGW2_9ACTN|nr:hypothetical protein [Actinocrinis puniceicyclus]MBS2961916.1 hypothetical protein [Actinocrinis puniceicyclus]
MSEPPASQQPAQPPTGPDRDQRAVPGGHDKREEIARATRRTPRDLAAERAFLQNKIDIVRTHSTLTEAQKQQAIAGLQRELRKLSQGADEDRP